MDGAKSGATVTGSAVTLSGYETDFIGSLKVSAIGATSLAAKIQHSPNGLDWFDLVTFTSATGVTAEIKPVTEGTYVLPYLRATLGHTGGTLGSTVSVKLFFAKR